MPTVRLPRPVPPQRRVPRQTVTTGPTVLVSIPAYNEAGTIAAVIASVPRRIAGVGQVQILVWDDGSTDQTAELARRSGADYVFRHSRNLGLAQTFERIRQMALALEADILVNTDADHQYDQTQLPRVLQPILVGQADLVTGNRQVEVLRTMPLLKRYGNRVGSFLIRALTGMKIQDASCGFRAYTAAVLRQVQVYSRHTYTHEILIQAQLSGFAITEVVVSFRQREQQAGSSRLIKSLGQHIIASGITIVRTILMFRAFEVFVSLGVIPILIALALAVRYLWFFWVAQDDGHVQSLILASMLFTQGLITIVSGILADLIMIRRQQTAPPRIPDVSPRPRK